MTTSRVTAQHSVWWQGHRSDFTFRPSRQNSRSPLSVGEQLRELVWSSSSPIAGAYHPAPDDADSQGCNWPVSLEIPTTADWKSGFHLITLTSLGAPEGRNIARRRRRPLNPTCSVSPVCSWHQHVERLQHLGWLLALHRWARSVISSAIHRGLLCREVTERDDRKARPVRWDEEPDPDGEIYQQYRGDRALPAAIGSSGWFIHERRFVEWAEGAGYTFDYAISSDLAEVDGILDGYDLVVSVGHDEYWSAGQRTALEAFIERGGNLTSFLATRCFGRFASPTSGQ